MPLAILVKIVARVDEVAISSWISLDEESEKTNVHPPAHPEEVVLNPKFEINSKSNFKIKRIKRLCKKDKFVKKKRYLV